MELARDVDVLRFPPQELLLVRLSREVRAAHESGAAVPLLLPSPRAPTFRKSRSAPVLPRPPGLYRDTDLVREIGRLQS